MGRTIRDLWDGKEKEIVRCKKESDPETLIDNNETDLTKKDKKDLKKNSVFRGKFVIGKSSTDNCKIIVLRLFFICNEFMFLIVVTIHDPSLDYIVLHCHSNLSGKLLDDLIGRQRVQIVEEGETFMTP